MNASIWQGPSGPLIGHIFLGVLSKLKPRASSALVETVYGMDEGTIGPLWARNTPSANEIRTAHGRICIFILLEADRTSIPSIVSHGRTMNVVVVDIRDYRRLTQKAVLGEGYSNRPGHSCCEILQQTAENSCPVRRRFGQICPNIR